MVGRTPSALALLLALALGPAPAPAFSSFKNFPVVGLREEPALSTQPEAEMKEDVREPREADISSYTDSSLDDTFIEEALFLTPEDREEREFTPRFEDWAEEESELEGEVEALRPERDMLGGHHGAGHHGAEHHGEEHMEDHQKRPVGRRREGRREGRRMQEQRAGRQTGGTGLAVGLLNSGPGLDGNYNFNYANEDSSTREEASGPDGVRGSYSFITPEGEQVRIQYVADETGFHATGSHVPQAPPMPPAIRRMLDHLAKVNGHAKLY